MNKILLSLLLLLFFPKAFAQDHVNTKQIDAARESCELVSVCSGCTYFAEVPLHDLLADENHLGAGRWLDIVIGERDQPE